MARSDNAENLIFSLQVKQGLGVWSGGIGGNELVDDVVLEAIGEVPDIERDPEDIGRSTRIGGVLTRTTSARTGPERTGRSRQRQVHPDDLVAGLDGTGRGNGRVDATAHRSKYPHQRSPAMAVAIPAACARATTSPITAPTASISSAVVDGASEKRRELRASAVDTPIAVSTWLARATPAGAGRTGRTFNTVGVEQHQQRITFTAGERNMYISGKSLRTDRSVDDASGARLG